MFNVRNCNVMPYLQYCMISVFKKKLCIFIYIYICIRSDSWLIFLNFSQKCYRLVRLVLVVSALGVTLSPLPISFLCFTCFFIQIKSDNELYFKDFVLCLLTPPLLHRKNPIYLVSEQCLCMCQIHNTYISVSADFLGSFSLSFYS